MPGPELDAPQAQDPLDHVRGLLDEVQQAEAAGEPANQGATDLLVEFAGNIEVEVTPSFTIPGTDEFIPGGKKYKFVITDKSGERVEQELDEDLAESWLAFRAAHAEPRASEPDGPGRGGRSGDPSSAEWASRQRGGKKQKAARKVGSAAVTGGPSGSKPPARPGKGTPPPATPPAGHNAAPGGPRTPETYKRGGETLPKDLVEWLKVERELGVVGPASADRLLALFNAVRRSAMRDDDMNWKHVKSYTWELDEHGNWTGTPELEDFVPPPRNGRNFDDLESINTLIDKVVSLSELSEHVVTDPDVREEYEEVMRAKFLSFAHTDRAREEAKRAAQGADYKPPVGEGLLEWETTEDDHDQRKTDFAKVQATVEKRLHNIKSAADYSQAYGVLSDLLSMSRPEDMEAILAKIVGGHTGPEEQALNALVDAAQISGSGRRAGKIKEQAKEFLPELMKQFDKSREGIWHDNVSEETREHMFARYTALTGVNIVKSWDPKTGRIINYDAVQMDEVLAMGKLDILAAANVHDGLLANKRKGAYGVPALVMLNVAGATQFGERDVHGHLQEPILGSQLEHMHSSGFLPNKHGYHNDYLNYVNALAEDRRTLEEWTTQEGWWYYVNHGPGSGDSKADSGRRQRLHNAQQALEYAATARRAAYYGIWQSDSVQTTMPQWYLDRRPTTRPSGGRGGRGGRP